MRNDRSQSIWLFLMVLSTFVGILLDFLTTNKPGDLLFYFTIQSNAILFVYAFITLVYIAIRRNKKLIWAQLAGFVTLCLTITGLVYATMLADWSNTLSVSGVSNVLLHIVSPVLVLAYFFIFTPKVKIPYLHAVYWLAYPLLFAVVSFIKGAKTGWYPYWFLNYSQLGNSLWLYLGAFTLAFLALGFLIIILNNKVKQGSIGPKNF